MAKPRAIRPVTASQRFIRMICYGEPGVGKSVFAGTSPNALILANDDDETSSPAVHGSDADVWVISDYNDLTEAYDYLRAEGHKNYEWVWLDNATLFQEQGLMGHIMLDLVARHPERNPLLPDKPQYMLNQNWLGDLVRKLKALPMHFGMTAHVMRMTDPITGMEVFAPDFQGGQGKFSQKLSGYMGVVGYYRVSKQEGKEIRTLFLRKQGKFTAKDRYDSTSNGRLIDPTIPKFMEGVAKKLPDLGKKPGSTSRPAKASNQTQTAKRKTVKRTPSK